MANYKMHLYVCRTDDSIEPIKAYLSGNDVYRVKSAVMPIVKTICSTNNLHENVIVEMYIENSDGEWCDSEEFMFNASNGEIVY